MLDVDNDNQSSASEYVPSEDALSEDEQNLSNELPQKQSINKTKSSVSSLDATQINAGSVVCNDEMMNVETSGKKFQKRHFCVFCSKL